MKKEVLEGEIVNEQPSIKRREKSSDLTEIEFTKLPGWRLLICLVPILGLLFSIVWYYYSKSKKRITIFPVIGIVISLFSSSTFIVLRFILRSIF